MKVILDIKKNCHHEKESDFLVENIEYVIYGLSVIKGKIYYYLCDSVHDDYPTTYSSELFKVIDSRVSRYWISLIDESSEITLELMFPEWINEIMFAHYLIDGDERREQIFKAYKAAMDLEFPDSAITEIAQIGDDEWLICPFCIDAWICQNSIDALVICPKCSTKFNNPRYKNEYPGVKELYQGHNS